ncbi:hypothetical protein SAMN05421734_106102 [Pelagirhabdus alkalitolerans]|uniref:Uncharacterized protein n=1 Tax=Pelagirhabdus alkalitolerans TaxID=1612202 RepID=A0A1G6KIJ5_9BACI|nr:hypothetical protein [Pelagirhabdus alkalitolerans]SDC30793.1 hypothetical protein SAMN05421734_106102 [Pelagirhabdus alkalitolerans]
MKKEWYDYIKNVEFGAKDQLNSDFEVLSFLAMTPDEIKGSIDHYLNIDTYTISRFRSQMDTFAYIMNQMSKDSSIYVVPTPIQEKGKPVIFYQLDVPLSIKDAIGLGLGVIRYLSGDQKGEIYYYSFVKDEDDQRELMEEAKAIERIKSYTLLQLSHEKRKKGNDRIIQSSKESLIFTDESRMLHQLAKLDFY